VDAFSKLMPAAKKRKLDKDSTAAEVKQQRQQRAGQAAAKPAAKPAAAAGGRASPIKSGSPQKSGDLARARSAAKGGCCCCLLLQALLLQALLLDARFPWSMATWSKPRCSRSRARLLGNLLLSGPCPVSYW
jgi:hypothetical protein